MASKKAKPKSTKSLQKKKATVQKKSSRKQSRPRRAAAPVSTYDVWLGQQVRERAKHPVESRPHVSNKMPTNTFDSWLKNQRVVEKQTTAHSVGPTATYEEWIRRQVAERQSKAEGEESSETVTEEQQMTAPS